MINQVNEVEVSYKRKLRELPHIGEPSDCFQYITPFYHPIVDYQESFKVMLLSRKNQILGMSDISFGTDTSTTVFIKKICQLAILTNASGVVVFHNHPSGNSKPSREDLKVTEKIKKALDIFSITLLDHLIIYTNTQGEMTFNSAANNDWL